MAAFLSSLPATTSSPNSCSVLVTSLRFSLSFLPLFPALNHFDFQPPRTALVLPLFQPFGSLDPLLFPFFSGQQHTMELLSFLLSPHPFRTSSSHQNNLVQYLNKISYTAINSSLYLDHLLLHFAHSFSRFLLSNFLFLADLIAPLFASCSASFQQPPSSRLLLVSSPSFSPPLVRVKASHRAHSPSRFQLQFSVLLWQPTEQPLCSFLSFSLSFSYFLSILSPSLLAK